MYLSDTEHLFCACSMKVRLARLRSIISEECGIKDVILDNFKNHGNGKRITVGLVDEVQASVMMAKMNGYFLDGKKLQVEILQKKAPPSQPFLPERQYYKSSISTPVMPFQNNSMMFPPEPPVKQDLNAYSNMPYYLAPVQTSYGNPDSFQLGPTVQYPPYEKQNTSNSWNLPTGFENQSFQYSSGQLQPKPNVDKSQQKIAQKRGFVTYESNSDFGHTNVGKRSRLNDRSDPNNYGGPRGNNSEREQGRHESGNQRISTNRSRSPTRDGFDNQSRYDGRDRDRYDGRERNRYDGPKKHRYDNRERGRYDNRECDRYDSRERGRIDNDERNSNDSSDHRDSRDRNRVRDHDSRGRGGNGPNNSTLAKPNPFGMNNRASDYGFGPKQVINEFNETKFVQSTGKFQRPNSFDQFAPRDKPLNQKKLRPILHISTRVITDEILLNGNLETIPPPAFTKLRALCSSRIKRIMTQTDNVCVNEIHELYRRQYPATEDKIVLDAAMGTPIESTRVQQQDANDNAVPRKKFIQNPAIRPMAPHAKLPQNQNAVPRKKFTQNSAIMPAPPRKAYVAPPKKTYVVPPKKTYVPPPKKTYVPPPKKTYVPPYARLPKNQNAVNKVSDNQIKKKQQEEAGDDCKHPKEYLPALEEELKALEEVFINACTPSQDAEIEKVRKEILNRRVKPFLKMIKWEVSRRLSGGFEATVKILYQTAPPREELDEFLKEFGVINLKMNNKKKRFIASCHSSDGFDRLVALGSAVVGGVPLQFKPLRVMGNLEKKRGAKKNKGKEVNYKQFCLSLKSNTVIIKDELQNTKNIKEESDNTHNIKEESDITHNVKEESDITHNVKEESNNTTHNIKVETQDTYKVTKYEIPINKEALSKIDHDDLEDF